MLKTFKKAKSKLQTQPHDDEALIGGLDDPELLQYEQKLNEYDKAYEEYLKSYQEWANLYGQETNVGTPKEAEFELLKENRRRSRR